MSLVSETDDSESDTFITDDEISYSSYVKNKDTMATFDIINAVKVIPEFQGDQKTLTNLINLIELINDDIKESSRNNTTEVKEDILFVKEEPEQITGNPEEIHIEINTPTHKDQEIEEVYKPLSIQSDTPSKTPGVIEISNSESSDNTFKALVPYRPFDGPVKELIARDLKNILVKKIISELIVQSVNFTAFQIIINQSNKLYKKIHMSSVNLQPTGALGRLREMSQSSAPVGETLPYDSLQLTPDEQRSRSLEIPGVGLLASSKREIDALISTLPPVPQRGAIPKVPLLDTNYQIKPRVPRHPLGNRNPETTPISQYLREKANNDNVVRSEE